MSKKTVILTRNQIEKIAVKEWRIKINKYFKHFKTITKHKIIVCRECIRCGYIWRGLMHDNSKFGLTEFFSSAKYFQGDKSPIEAEKAVVGYSLAWQHHMGHNPHHWEYWIDYGKHGEIIVNKIPYPYVVEMVCDYIGAGMVYNKEKWNESEPLNYFLKVRKGRYYHSETEDLILRFLNTIKDNGLEAFYKEAKSQKDY